MGGQKRPLYQSWVGDNDVNDDDNDILNQKPSFLVFVWLFWKGSWINMWQSFFPL